MLKKTLIVLWLFVAFTSGVWADEPLQAWLPKSGLRSDTAMLASPEPSATWQSMLTRFGPRFPDQDDRMLYCAVDNAPKIIRSEDLQGSAPEDKSSQKQWPEQNWGIAAGVRVARIPFDTRGDTVTSVVPQLYYEDDLIFLRGLEGGIKITGTKAWQFNALGRLRFFDIPKRFQNEIQEDTVDLGLQLRYLPGANAFVEWELLSDQDFRFHSNIRTGLTLEHGAFEWTPYVNLDFKSADFNDYYYGLDVEDVGAGIDLSAGIKAEYHVISNLYLIGSFQLTWLDHNVRHSAFVDKDFLDETFLGVKFSNEKKKSRKKTLRNRPYLRISHGWATPSNLGEIISGDTESDRYDNQLTSIFYGHPLTDELFGLPLDIYLTPGFVWHWSSKVQSSSQEYVVAIKAYYTFNWPITWRLGAAEGASYASQVTYIEETELNKKDYEVSKLMNYLDFSVDINLSKLFGCKGPSTLWLGYAIHHRSAIFETASHFGRIKGGSNYNTVYLQWHF
jgi:outer membrane protein